MTIKMIVEGRKDEFNTKAIFAACWTRPDGKKASSRWSTERCARNYAEVVLHRAPEGYRDVYIRKVWCAGFVI